MTEGMNEGKRKGPITLEELIDLGEGHARRILLEKREEEMAPLWHLVTPEGEQDFIIMTPWSRDFEKKMAVAKIKEMAHEHRAIAIGFVIECWMLVQNVPEGTPNTPWHREQALRNIPFVRPSQSPDRIEAVMILAHDKERTIAKGFQTIRDKPGGRIVSLVEHMPIGESTFESWMLEGMLP